MQNVEIRVKGRLDADWSEWFEGFKISYQGEAETSLEGVVQDQATLYGLLTRLRDLGLALVSVKTSDPENGNQEWLSIENSNK